MKTCLWVLGWSVLFIITCFSNGTYVPKYSENETKVKITELLYHYVKKKSELFFKI